MHVYMTNLIRKAYSSYVEISKDPHIGMHVYMINYKFHDWCFFTHWLWLKKLAVKVWRKEN